MTQTPCILIVDDHTEIRTSVARFLERHDMTAVVAADTQQMDTILKEKQVDLIVLDIMMPGEDGLTASKRLRETSDIPILLLTALDGDENLLEGFATGADDYLPKPFNPQELLARVRAILRRTQKPSGAQSVLDGKRVAVGGIIYDVDARVIRHPDGSHEVLTSGEAALLSVLVLNPRTVLRRDELLLRCTGRTAGPFDRTIDNQISRLRKKIEPDVLRPRIISTVRNGGYSLTSDVEFQP